MKEGWDEGRLDEARLDETRLDDARLYEARLDEARLGKWLVCIRGLNKTIFYRACLWHQI